MEVWGGAYGQADDLGKVRKHMVKQKQTFAGAEIRTLLDLLQEQIASDTVQPEIVGRLRQAVEKHQTILDSITDGLLVLDRDWRYTYFNENGARMIGMCPEELIGGCVWDFFPSQRPPSSTRATIVP